jgi:hypothetical protein
MDEFDLERPELTGTLISMEFGSGGRIQQLWVADPTLREPGEEFQCVLPPISFGEEFSEDYSPGTFLIGARTDPREPWVLSRNTDAETLADDPNGVVFRYELPLLPEIEARGRFFELGQPIPQIVWQLELRNAGRSSIEIGELAFPMALNNIYEGHSRTDSGLEELWSDRLYLHKSIGGAASYLFAQRLNARPPGLLIFPGDETSWEFYGHVPASLQTSFRWEGIPMVYVHSRASIEREGWPTWFNGHSSLILEPGESRRFETRFAPADRERIDSVFPTLAACGRPTVKLFPGAVAPAHVGIAVEIDGAVPSLFRTDSKADLETDTDENGGFAFVKPDHPGPIKLTFDDKQRRRSSVHLLFTDPLDELIQRRATWIVEHQVQEAPPKNLAGAILPADLKTSRPHIDPDSFMGSFGVVSSLADALYLAEKNTLYPVEWEIRVLDRFIEEFLRDDVQNPGDDSVGSSFSDDVSVATDTARPHVYPLVACFYQAMYRTSRFFGSTAHTPEVYLRWAARTAIAMFDCALGRDPHLSGIPVAAHLSSIVDDLQGAGEFELAEQLDRRIRNRYRTLLRKKYPYAGDSLWTTDGFEEVFAAALALRDEEQLERCIRCAFAARSLAPSWWWYGSDKRYVEYSEGVPHPVLRDAGELCLGPSTPANSGIFFKMLDRDYLQLPDAHLRQAFGGLLGVWALVRPDGAASMGFCPDAASKQFGVAPLTGDVGISLFQYLRHTGAYVLPSRSSGVATFGCHFEAESDPSQDLYTVRPWDGVGRKVVVRQVGLEIESLHGGITQVRFDARKRWAEVRLRNATERDLKLPLRVRGMWGEDFEILGNSAKSTAGELTFSADVPRSGEVNVEVRVKR